MKDYISVNKYIKETFGQKVYKIGLDGGFTCPNRDGTLGNRGCIFCSGAGSGDFTRPDLNIDEQIEAGKRLLSKKIDPNNGKYIAYFQAFTNTYAPIDYLRKVYYQALRRDDIVAISIATRPDCLGKEVIELIDEMNRQKPVWVELGLQTINPKTAEYIRRGYELSAYDKAVDNLKQMGIPQIITHVILGLPGEKKKDMLDTIEYVSKSGSNGIKLQLLHVLKGTDLARDYEKGLFKTLEMDEYLDILRDALRIIPDGMVIHRLTGDGAKRDLIAPLWSADKKKVLSQINKILED